MDQHDRFGLLSDNSGRVVILFLLVASRSDRAAGWGSVRPSAPHVLPNVVHSLTTTKAKDHEQERSDIGDLQMLYKALELQSTMADVLRPSSTFPFAPITRITRFFCTHKYRNNGSTGRPILHSAKHEKCASAPRVVQTTLGDKMEEARMSAKD